MKMKKVLCFCLASILLLQGCRSKNVEPEVTSEEYKHQIQILEEKFKNLQEDVELKNHAEISLNDNIRDLENEVDELQHNIEYLSKASDNFAVLSNMALEFVRAQTQGDTVKLISLVSGEITIMEEDSKIYGTYTAFGEDIKYQLFDKSMQTQYMDMVVQGYGYDEVKDTYNINIAEFYKDNLSNYFLNLSFKSIDGKWKIVEFYLDI